jgi:hypothetical protein
VRPFPLDATEFLGGIRAIHLEISAREYSSWIEAASSFGVRGHFTWAHWVRVF